MRIGPEVSENMQNVVMILEGFCEQCLGEELIQDRDYDSEADWERITLHPTFTVEMTIVLLDFMGDFSCTITFNGKRLETENPEDIFDLTVQAFETIND